MFVLLSVLFVGFQGARLNVSLEPDALAVVASDALKSARAALIAAALHGAACESSNYSAAYSLKPHAVGQLNKVDNARPAALALVPIVTHTLSGPLLITREDTTTDSRSCRWLRSARAGTPGTTRSRGTMPPRSSSCTSSKARPDCWSTSAPHTGCWVMRKREWLDKARAFGCVSARIEPRERLFGRQLFRMRAHDVIDSPL